LLAPQEAHVYKVLKIKDTDRATTFRNFGEERSVGDFLSHMLDAQGLQIQALNWSILTRLTPDMAADFQRRLEKNLEENRSHFKAINEAYATQDINLREMRKSEDPKMQQLQSQVITFIARSNTILAELLAAVHFEKTVSGEKSIATIIGDTRWQRLEKELQEQFPPADIENFSTRQMDVVAQQNGVTYWVEVKYLGRNKEYNELSGYRVYTKMQIMKFLADQMPEATKVAVMTVGPGRLTEKALRRFEDIGVEVFQF